MKKINYIFMILVLFINFTGCDLQNSKYINFSVKPNNHYYLDEIKNKFLDNESFTLYMFDTNLYKEIEVSKDETPIIEDFIFSLTNENYSDETVPEKEPFRIKITFDDKNQYLIKIFNNSIISISPWDGLYKEDIISMNNLPLKYNLFEFCNHIANKPLAR